MHRWLFEDAQQQFELLVERARTEGPQIVTRQGEAVVVVLGIDEYRRLTEQSPV